MCRVAAKVSIAHTLCGIVWCLLLRRIASVTVSARRRSIACLRLRPVQHVRRRNTLIDRAIFAARVCLVSSRISRAGAPRRAAHILVRLLLARGWVDTLLGCKGFRGSARDPVAVWSIVVVCLASMASGPIIVRNTTSTTRTLAILRSRRVMAVSAVVAVPTPSYVRLWTR